MAAKVKQLRGPFIKGQELLDEYPDILKLAIFSKVSHYVTINGIEFELGKTGMLEIQNTKIHSLFFNQDENPNTYIDFII